MPPAASPWGLIPAFTGLLLLLGWTRTRWGAFGIGWAFAFAFHLYGLRWIGEAFLVDAERFGWMRPFVISGLPAGLALFVGLAAVAFVTLRSRRAFADVLLFAALFMAAEWLRGHVLTGFPWNLPVYALDRQVAWQQSVAWIGPYGLSLALVVAAAAPAVLVARLDLRRPDLRRLAGFLALVLPAAALIAAGERRLAQAPAVSPSVPDVRLRIVQPNIPQREKWVRELRAAHFRLHLALSTEGRPDDTTLVIWPEAAATFPVTESEAALKRIGEAAPPGGGVILGTPRRRRNADGATVPGNAVVVVDEAGAPVDVYDKQHLVPLGEYVPEWLPIDRLAPGHGSFRPGAGPRLLTAPGGLRFSPLVCYEAIFPGAVTEPGGMRPQGLLNLTNDAWFGTSAGPHQHFAIARLRAIEEGLPLVRAANTGISAIVDPYGRVVGRLGINTRGVIDTRLPQPVASPAYPLLRDWPFAAVVAAILLLSSALRPRRRIG